MRPGTSRTNHILSTLSQADLSLLEPYLEPADLPLRRILQQRNKPIEHVYFPDSGFASVVANGDQPIEIGMIGREGMTGVSIVLGSESAPLFDTYIQMAGSGRRIATSDFGRAIRASPTLHAVLLRYAHSFLMQTIETALANGLYKIEERLARWLLIARDRADSDDLPLTHEFVAIMLGVRRSGVTIALRELARRGMITHRRSVITIVDRDALERSTNGAYSQPLKDY